MKLIQLSPRATPDCVGKRIEIEKFAFLPTKLTDGSLVWLEKVLYLLEGEQIFTNLGMDKLFYWHIKRKLRCKDEQANTTPSIPMQNETSKEVCMVSIGTREQENDLLKTFCSGRHCNFRCYLQNTCVEADEKKGQI